jgi:anti-sigma factor RsiW
MGCEVWRDKLDLYADGELGPAEAQELSAHVRSCAPCAAGVLERVQLKRSLAAVGTRYLPTAALREKITRTVAAKPRPLFGWQWRILAAPAVLVLIVSIAVNWYVGRESARRKHVYSELADLHVVALASTTPVDVVSTDRHTVKPWFQGKIPFSFNLPELQGTEFTLLGGRVTYLAQTPGAHLIYQIRKHEISVFIFQDRGTDTATLPSGPTHAASFNMENWAQNGLRYFVVGDVSNGDIQALSRLLQDAK